MRATRELGSNGGRVVEIDIDTLETVGVLQLPDAVTNGVAVSPDGQRIYVSTYMNHLYAFERLSDVQNRDALPALAAP